MRICLRRCRSAFWEVRKRHLVEDSITTSLLLSCWLEDTIWELWSWFCSWHLLLAFHSVSLLLDLDVDVFFFCVWIGEIKFELKILWKMNSGFRCYCWETFSDRYSKMWQSMFKMFEPRLNIFLGKREFYVLCFFFYIWIANWFRKDERKLLSLPSPSNPTKMMFTGMGSATDLIGFKFAKCAIFAGSKNKRWERCKGRYVQRGHANK